MIKKASECSIRIFMRCLFEKNYEGVENWDGIYTEYIDLSGLGETRQKDILIAMHNIQVRMVVIPAMIQFQIDYFVEYQEPYKDGFWFFTKYGHRLIWDIENPKEFARQLEMVLIREKKFKAELDKLKKEFSKLSKELKDGTIKPDDEGRISFIKMLNTIEAHRKVNIDRDQKDIESYALMIKEYSEFNKQRKYA